MLRGAKSVARIALLRASQPLLLAARHSRTTKHVSHAIAPFSTSSSGSKVKKTERVSKKDVLLRMIRVVDIYRVSGHLHAGMNPLSLPQERLMEYVSCI